MPKKYSHARESPPRTTSPLQVTVRAIYRQVVVCRPNHSQRASSRQSWLPSVARHEAQHKKYVYQVCFRADDRCLLTSGKTGAISVRSQRPGSLVGRSGSVGRGPARRFCDGRFCGPAADVGGTGGGGSGFGIGIGVVGQRVSADERSEHHVWA
jgi:hypothetical protein